MVLALLSVAAVWAVAAVVLLGVFAATSYDDFQDLARTATRAAVPAVWFVPAAFFLQGGSIWEAVVGLALVANAVRLLVSARPPRRLELKSRGRRRDAVRADVFFTRTLPLIGGALLLQSGLAAVLTKRPNLAAVLVGCATVVIGFWWTSRPVSSLRRVITTLMVAVILTVLQFRVVSGPRIRVAANPKPPSFMPLTGGVDAKDLKPLPGKSLVPGVILRPTREAPKIEALDLLPASRQGMLRSKPMVLNFTGEYHVFPASSGHVQADSAVLKGSPLDGAYVSMAGGAIETEALQPLNPPIDLTNCGRIEVTLRTNEQSPGSATLYLVSASGSLELGTEIFGFEPRASETLEVAVPALPADLRVKAIRLLFRRDPFNRTQSTRVAVDKFTFLPRF